MTAATFEVLATFDIAGEPAEVARARHAVADAINGHPRHDEIILLTSELVTNAVIHSDSALPGGKVRIRVLRSSAGTIRVEVIDAGSRQRHPHLPDVDIYADHGKGLSVVDGVSLTWGSFTDDTGCTVWFEIATS